MFKLRDYQVAAVDAPFEYFEKHGAKSGNPLILLPTGTGKSLVIAGILQRVHNSWPNCRTMVITHVKELIEQNYDKLMRLWPDAPAGIYSAGAGRKDKYSMITFAGIQSVSRVPQYFQDVELIIVDEADLISPNQQTSYQKFISAIREVNPYVKVIGLTATGWRLGYGSIIKDEDDDRALFDEIVFDACNMECFNWFINEGYLVPLVPKSTTIELDVKDVKKAGGEYVAKELQNAVNKPEVTRSILKDAIELAEQSNRSSWLIFCSGVDHAKDVCLAMHEFGISCEVVTGDTPKQEREKILDDFRSGKLKCVANNNVLTTGFDHPSLDLMIILRPSGSSRLWVQILGRGTRPAYADGFDLTTTQGRLAAIAASHKQNCLVLDYSGNTPKLGPINDPVIPKRPGKGGSSGAPVKKCPKCGVWNHASVRYCGGAPFPNQAPDFCGHEFTFEKKLKLAASTKALIKNDLPKTEVFKVNLVSYCSHINRGDKTKPPTLRVDYHCEGRATVISEWICLFHDGFAGNKARRWWRDHCNEHIPSTMDEALSVAAQLRIPTHINVNLSKKFPEVLSCCYDGTAWGKLSEPEAAPEVEVVTDSAVMKSIKSFVNKYDEDDKPIATPVNVGEVRDASGMPEPTDFDDDDIPF